MPSFGPHLETKLETLGPDLRRKTWPPIAFFLIAVLLAACRRFPANMFAHPKKQTETESRAKLIQEVRHQFGTVALLLGV